MKYAVTGQLRQWLEKEGWTVVPAYLDVDGDAFMARKQRLQAAACPNAELEDRAAFWLMTAGPANSAKPEPPKPQAILMQQDQLLKAHVEATAALNQRLTEEFHALSHHVNQSRTHLTTAYTHATQQITEGLHRFSERMAAVESSMDGLRRENFHYAAEHVTREDLRRQIRRAGRAALVCGLVLFAVLLGATIAYGQTTVNPGRVSSTAPTYTENARVPLRTDEGGNLYTVAATSSGTQAINVTQVRGTNVPSPGSGAMAVIGITSSGTTAVGNPVIVGGLSSANVVALSVDSTGRLNTNTTITSADVNLTQVSGSSVVTAAAGIPVVGLVTTSGRIGEVTLPVMVSGTPAVTLTATNGTIGQVNVGTFPDNEPINVAQIGGVAPVMVSGTPAVTLTATAGAIGAVTQSGTWTVQPGNTANTTPWLVTVQSGSESIVTTGVQTYAASTSGGTVAAAATDFVTITGSATRTVEVMGVTVNGSSNSASVYTVQLIKRSTANSGGTSETLAATPMDSNNNAATATVLKYSVNPTLGTQIGSPIVTAGVFMQAPAVQLPQITDLLIGTYRTLLQPITLRGTSEVLALNLAGQTIPVANLRVTITWTEK